MTVVSYLLMILSIFLLNMFLLKKLKDKALISFKHRVILHCIEFVILLVAYYIMENRFTIGEPLIILFIFIFITNYEIKKKAK